MEQVLFVTSQKRLELRDGEGQKVEQNNVMVRALALSLSGSVRSARVWGLCFFNRNKIT